jgi:hypothetical protein
MWRVDFPAGGIDVWVFVVCFPLRRIAGDILADAVPFIVVANAVFVIIALP